MALDFPATPGVGDTYTSGGVVWVWDGAKWQPNGLAVAYLPLTGGTLTGNLTAPGIIAPQVMGDNRIINGDMRIDQRNGTGRNTSASNWVVDHWFVSMQNASLNWAQGQGVGAPLGFGFEYWVGIACQSAYTPAAADVFELYQPIEADIVSDLAFGTVSARPITLSFCIYVTIAGTYSGSIYNNDGSRSYPFTFSVPNAATWTQISVTIPGDTGGTWVAGGNSTGMYLIFDLGCGSSYRGPANTWASAHYVGATGAISLVSNLNAQFAITGIKLEVGSVATPFNRQSLAKSLADCQRYYERSGNPGDTFATLTGCSFMYMTGTIQHGGMTSFFKTTKRAQPTIAIYSAGTGAVNMIYDQNATQDVPVTLFTEGLSCFGWYGAAVNPTGVNFAIQWTANAELS